MAPNILPELELRAVHGCPSWEGLRGAPPRAGWVAWPPQASLLGTPPNIRVFRPWRVTVSLPTEEVGQPWPCRDRPLQGLSGTASFDVVRWAKALGGGGQTQRETCRRACRGGQVGLPSAPRREHGPQLQCVPAGRARATLGGLSEPGLCPRAPRGRDGGPPTSRGIMPHRGSLGLAGPLMMPCKRTNDLFSATVAPMRPRPSAPKPSRGGRVQGRSWGTAGTDRSPLTTPTHPGPAPPPPPRTQQSAGRPRRSVGSEAAQDQTRPAMGIGILY